MPAKQQGSKYLRRNILFATFALLLILAGVAAIILLITTQYQSHLHIQATAQARIVQNTRQAMAQADSATAQALATADANIYATATAQSGATATSTTQVDLPTGTATALQNLLTQATKGTPILDDPLSDNTTASTKGNLWDVGTSTKNSGCAFTGGSYHASEAQIGMLQPCLAQTPTFSNFVYQAQMIIDKGSQGGLLFRADGAKGQYYLFRVGTNGAYTLEVYGSHLTTLSSGFSPAISEGLGQSNQLTVLAQNDMLYLYINQTFVASTADKTLSAGQIGVVALDYGAPTEVEFSQAQVWKL